MFNNMSTVDRIIRVVIAAVLIWMYFTGRASGALAIVLLIVAAVFLFTSVRGFCPGYLLFKKRP